MPTYEYVCKNCGERFEKVQSFKARPLKTHATCGGPVQKVFHASGVVFKGPGFYATDSRVSSSSDSSSNGSSDSKSESTKGETKKPEKAGATTTTEKATSTSSSND